MRLVKVLFVGGTISLLLLACINAQANKKPQKEKDKNVVVDNKNENNPNFNDPEHHKKKEPPVFMYESNDRNTPDVFKPNRSKPNKKNKHENQGNNKNGNKHKVNKTHNKKEAPPPKNSMKWKPKPDKTKKKPPKGYSGWKPNKWGTGGHAFNDQGEMSDRISQQKFEQYMKEIFGEDEIKENELLSPDDLNGREVADPGEYPHAVAIGIIRDYEDVIDWKCGGSLIARRFVLTAAHCTDFGGQDPTHAQVGAIDIRKPGIRNGSQIIKIEEEIIHPYYNDSSYYYDIALLRLGEPAAFSFLIRPIRLWPFIDIPFEVAFACGYGATQFGKVQTNVLTEMELDLIGNEKCNETLPSLPETEFGILDNQVCAMDLEGKVDTCQGDSGGPLQLVLPGRRRPRHSLIGIISYGVFCGSTYPGVYTRVYSFLDWIESVVWPNI